MDVTRRRSRDRFDVSSFNSDNEVNLSNQAQEEIPNFD